LLQKLDGLESANGRIIIATTNNPDKINPTLMRPGRFDIKICLNNCTQHMYEDILENFYENEENVKIRVSNAKIPTYKYSPLEIINLAMQYNNLDTLLHKLLS
jgi:chaperone BCS1